MHVARAFHKLTQKAKRFGNIFEAVLCQYGFPFQVTLFELTQQRRGRFGIRQFGGQNFLEEPSHVARMLLVSRLEGLETVKTHQARQPFTGRPISRDRVGLAIFLHLQAMLEVTQKSIGLGKQLGFLEGEQLILP